MINLDIKKLLKTSFNLGKQNYWELLFLTILPSICFYLIFFYVLFNGYKNFSDSILILAGLFTFILLSIIIFPFMSSLILESMNQPNLQFKYWRYLFYTIAINIIIVLGFMFLFLPSIYLTFIFLFVPLLALLGDEKPFINSKKLVKNYFWIILGLVLVCSSFGALAGAIYKFFIFAFEKSVYFGFLKFLFISLIMPFLLPIHFILYFRLKAEKENEDVLEKYNLDIEQLENKKKFSNNPLLSFLVKVK